MQFTRYPTFIWFSYEKFYFNLWKLRNYKLSSCICKISFNLISKTYVYLKDFTKFLRFRKH